MFQLGWFTITVMLTASFELLIFILGYFGSDYKFPNYPSCTGWKKIFKSFQFLCHETNEQKWDIDGASTTNMMVFKFHIIVIFMYTMTIWVVLWEVPYRYDRIKKTKEEKKKARKNQRKKAKSKAKKSGKKVTSNNQLFH